MPPPTLARDKALGWPGQIAASLWAIAVYGGLYARGGALERRVLLAGVLIAGRGECCLSLRWGLCDYQLHNVPPFAPPGPALLMTSGLMTAGRMPPWAVPAVPCAAAPWTLAGACQGWDTAGAPCACCSSCA